MKYYMDVDDQGDLWHLTAVPEGISPLQLRVQEKDRDIPTHRIELDQIMYRDLQMFMIWTLSNGSLFRVSCPLGRSSVTIEEQITWLKGKGKGE